jgi:hypothetical protein
LVQIKFITEDSEQTHKHEKEATKHGFAWEIETGSILIKEKHKHLSKMPDRVSKLLEAQALKV